jgi:hypothetical protein
VNRRRAVLGGSQPKRPYLVDLTPASLLLT